MGLFQHRLCVHPETGQIQKAVTFRCSPGVPGVGFPPAGIDVSRVFQEAVLQLLFPWLLQPSKDALCSRHGNAVFLLQILCRQGFQEYHAAVSVRHRMEKLHGNALFIGNHPEGTVSNLPAAHTGHRIAVLFPDGRGPLPLLEIIPEQTPPQPHAHGREPAHRHIQRRLQHRHIYFLRQRHRQAEYVAPALSQGRWIDFRCVVQPHPPELSLPGQILGEEGIHGHPVLPVFVQAIEKIGMPPAGMDGKLAHVALL